MKNESLTNLSYPGIDFIARPVMGATFSILVSRPNGTRSRRIFAYEIETIMTKDIGHSDL